ncbi:hypothetical protein H6761_03280 [Candidatus Nomurabacteria bacterium]|nr:hypothetical protein [Candidatus Nomurabacteria bacterium]
MAEQIGRPIITREHIRKSPRIKPIESIDRAFAVLTQQMLEDLRGQEEKIRKGEKPNLESLKQCLATFQECVPHLECGNLEGARRLLARKDLWIELPNGNGHK